MNDPFATAMQLLLAERPARHELQRAGELLEQASSEGHAQASERCALFEAFGTFRPPDWSRALDFLALAAEQGSRSAQEQLLILEQPDGDQHLRATSEVVSWPNVRAAIDIEGRLTPGQALPVSERPRLRVLKCFASPAECRFLVAQVQGRLAPAPVFHNRTGEQTVNPARDNSHFVLGIEDMNILTEVIRTRIAAAARLPVPLFEPSQILHYAIGESFKPHYDFLDPSHGGYRNSLDNFGQRLATLLIYLNDGYSGGETSFPAIDFHFRAELGDALLFANVTREGAPDQASLHEGQPVSAGEKWVFSQWIRDRVPAH